MLKLGIFRDNSFFIGSNAREAVNAGRADFIPIFLSEIPLLFNRRIINLDVALINVSQKFILELLSLMENIFCFLLFRCHLLISMAFVALDLALM